MITWSEPSHIIALIFMFNWIALSLKLSLTGLLTGVFRGVEKIPKTQEDAKLAKVDLVTEESTKFNDSKVKRMGLIHPYFCHHEDRSSSDLSTGFGHSMFLTFIVLDLFWCERTLGCVKYTWYYLGHIRLYSCSYDSCLGEQFG
jgi:hypothetical protein